MKFELDQEIHYMLNNILHSASVLARMQVENLFQDYASTQQQKELFTPFGNAGVYYRTCNGIINENDAFTTKKDMIQALCKHNLKE